MGPLCPPSAERDCLLARSDRLVCHKALRYGAEVRLYISRRRAHGRRPTLWGRTLRNLVETQPGCGLTRRGATTRVETGKHIFLQRGRSRTLPTGASQHALGRRRVGIGVELRKHNMRVANKSRLPRQRVHVSDCLPVPQGIGWRGQGRGVPSEPAPTPPRSGRSTQWVPTATASRSGCLAHTAWAEGVGLALRAPSLERVPGIGRGLPPHAH